MTARILVAYATRKGSTAEIAQAVGKELESAGHTVDIVEAKTVRTVEGYNAVVIGAPMYMGSIVKDAGKFVGQYRDQLAKLPVAAFAVGMAPVSKDAKQLEDSLKALHASLAPLRPVAATMFAGKLDPTKLSFIQKKMTEFVKAPVGDYRDWNAIAAWARELPRKMGV
jgi:menaquinone-dependent protoporphyrinogen oxidase